MITRACYAIGVFKNGLREEEEREMINQKGKLSFFCGKMGAGKSTTSKKISSEKNAVLLSEDDWLSSHYPEQINVFEDYLNYSAIIRPFVRSLVQNILNTGTNVVMDFPANTVGQRNWFKQLCSEINCEHELIFLDVSDEQCWLQIQQRRMEQPERAQFDTKDVFNHVTKFFEAPSEDEGLTIVRMKIVPQNNGRHGESKPSRHAGHSTKEEIG